jgi:hypothetical protein
MGGRLVEIKFWSNIFCMFFFTLRGEKEHTKTYGKAKQRPCAALLYGIIELSVEFDALAWRPAKGLHFARGGGAALLLPVDHHGDDRGVAGADPEIALGLECR